MTKKIKPFETDIINWTLVTSETAKLIINQSELLLKESIETAKTITAKAEKFIAIEVTSGTGLVVFIFNSYRSVSSYLILTAIICLIAILTSLIFSLKAYANYTIYVTGEHPRVVAATKFIDNDYTPEQQYINMALHIICNTQDKIDLNSLSNQKRRNQNTIVIYILLSIILCPAVSYLLLKFFPGLHF